MEDEEWEDVMVVSFVYSNDDLAAPQTPGKLVAFKRRLKTTYQQLEFGEQEFKGTFYDVFRSPSNHLVMLSFATDCLRIFDRCMKPVAVNVDALKYHTSSPYLSCSSDYKSVALFHFDHDRNKYNLVVYNIESNTFRACLEISGTTFEIYESRTKIKPFKFLNMHSFTAAEAFFFSESLDYTRIDLATGKPTFLFNLREVDDLSHPEFTLSVPKRPGSLSELLNIKNKQLAISSAAENKGYSSVYFVNEFRLNGCQTTVTPTKVCRFDGYLQFGAPEVVREGYLTVTANNSKDRRILLLRTNPSIHNQTGEPQALEIKDALEDRDAVSTGVMRLKNWTPRLGGYTIGIYGWGRTPRVKGSDGTLFMKLWILSRGKFQTHQIPIPGFGRGWQVCQLGPGVRSMRSDRNQRNAQLMISLEGTGKENKGKIISMMATLQLRA